jgi:RNA polymerase sigma-70 factor (ECF subfamily)
MNQPLDRIYQRLLVLRCQTGDQRAFEELVGRFHDRLRRFVRSLLPDAHTADDVLQDAWLDVWRSIGKLRDADALEAWLFRVARDRAYRVLRRKPVAHGAGPIEQAEIVDESDVQLAADERELVTTSLNRLALEQREVLLLRFVEQLSYEQIAATIGCELGTVRSRLHYAKAALRQLIERNHP